MATAGMVGDHPDPGMRIVGVNAFGYADCNLHGDGFNASYFYGDNGDNYGVPQITIDCARRVGQQHCRELQRLYPALALLRLSSLVSEIRGLQPNRRQRAGVRGHRDHAGGAGDLRTVIDG